MKPPARPRAFALVVSLVAACALAPFRARTQEFRPRPLTRTPHETTNLNPTLSGDGRTVVFESNAAPPDSNQRAGFQTMTADLSSETLTRVAATRAPSAAVSQDGKTFAFASLDDPLGANADRNSEIFLHTPAGLAQLTATLPDDPSARTSHGSFRPSISDDGRLVAFSSNRDLTGENPDRNLELFLLDTHARSVTQLTRTTPPLESRDAKLSGDGHTVAFLRRSADDEPSLAATSDLVLYDLTSGVERVVAEKLDAPAFTYGRAVSDDGKRVVFSASTAPNTTQVFLYDGRNGRVRQLTSLSSRTTDVPPHPTISGDGSRVAFATRRNPVRANTDGGVELFLYDIPTLTLTQITDAPAAATAEVVSSLDDSGSRVAFSFPRALASPEVPPDF
ncbi:MAG TPA: hypothetical protein VER32_01755, partial [Pyrinomonadaceae bacterium]|nr:hypothetical protein [Pyrinomonadaceae bacterium]